MAEFVKPIIENVISALEYRTPTILAAAGLPAIAHFGRQFTGVVPRFPAVYVMPVRTVFNSDSELRHQAHQIQITLAVSGGSPDAVTEAAMDYMAAIDTAIEAGDPADWQGVLQGGLVLRVFTQAHDYGPLYQGNNAAARFPEMELIVEATE